jgi:hypothetical protein
MDSFPSPSLRLVLGFDAFHQLTSESQFNLGGNLFTLARSQITNHNQLIELT